jgi:hypothetical protein
MGINLGKVSPSVGDRPVAWPTARSWRQCGSGIGRPDGGREAGATSGRARRSSRPGPPGCGTCAGAERTARRASACFRARAASASALRWSGWRETALVLAVVLASTPSERCSRDPRRALPSRMPRWPVAPVPGSRPSGHPIRRGTPSRPSEDLPCTAPEATSSGWPASPQARRTARADAGATPVGSASCSDPFREGSVGGTECLHRTAGAPRV